MTISLSDLNEIIDLRDKHKELLDAIYAIDNGSPLECFNKRNGTTFYHATLIGPDLVASILKEQLRIKIGSVEGRMRELGVRFE